MVQLHAEFGYGMVAHGTFSADILDAVRHHYEKLESSGYREGLGGCVVCNVVRMVTICDAYEPLIEPSTNRPSLVSPPASGKAVLG